MVESLSTNEEYFQNYLVDLTADSFKKLNDSMYHTSMNLFTAKNVILKMKKLIKFSSAM